MDILPDVNRGNQSETQQKMNCYWAVCFALFALLQLPSNAQRQFALTDKVGQGNFAYGGSNLYAGEEPRFYRLMGKRAQRFAYESETPFSGKFAKLAPSAQREFAFAFAKRAQ